MSAAPLDTSSQPVKAAIVDYGLGNLFSVLHACRHSGIDAFITSSPQEIAEAQALILPGVGAFADAMACLNRLDLCSPIRDFSQSGRPMFGICLGLQLLFTESEEFGSTKGLGIIEGSVKRLNHPCDPQNRPLKIPHIGWNLAFPSAFRPHAWLGTPLEPLGSQAMMYFVHSFCVAPVDSSVVLAETTYGDQTYCSAIHRENLSAFQFHPERSGVDGIRVYRHIRQIISNNATPKT
jgi:imidazole glycerol-phosphate synthase subunit HisH